MRHEPSLDSLASIRRAGFEGFITIRELRDCGVSLIPDLPGVYLVLRRGRKPPRYREASRAGHFNGRDPSVPIAVLRSSWVSGTPVLYIGKAGSPRGQSTLRSRLRAYVRHGSGHAAPHWGGRFIWQIYDSESLELVWKILPRGDPRRLKRSLLRALANQFARFPFANRRL